MRSLITDLTNNLGNILEPIANQFQRLGTPEPIVQWGHPFFMAIVIFVMGSFVGLAGWRGRLVADEQESLKSRTDHRKIAPLMSIFLAAGYTGGLLSLIMQKQPILESPYFWTGSTVLILLAVNAAISLTGFGGNKPNLRTTHAFLGSIILCLLFLHAALGLKLGLSI